MGMDVFGRNPDSEAGSYFRASIWQWAPLYEALVALCADLVDKETLAAMEYNDGAGPTDAAVCSEVATRFENWLVGPNFVDRPTVSMLGISAIETLDGAPVQELVVDRCEVLAGCEFRDLVKDWIRFLRHCGGFVV